MRPDAVTPRLWLAVVQRDRCRCVAPSLGAADDCRGPFGENPWLDAEQMFSSSLTLDHVKDQPRMGKRAPSDAAHLVTLCWHHHLDGWATAHRPELRAYLREVEALP